MSLWHPGRYYNRVRHAFTRAENRGPASAAAESTSSEDRGRSSTPAAMLVHRVKPSTSMPQWAAAMASGTVDLPTASAPSSRAARTSAGVSYWGPGNYI